MWEMNETKRTNSYPKIKQCQGGLSAEITISESAQRKTQVTASLLQGLRLETTMNTVISNRYWWLICVIVLFHWVLYLESLLSGWQIPLLLFRQPSVMISISPPSCFFHGYRWALSARLDGCSQSDGTLLFFFLYALPTLYLTFFFYSTFISAFFQNVYSLHSC